MQEKRIGYRKNKYVPDERTQGGLHKPEPGKGVTIMADIGKSLKGIWLKGMEAVSNTASNIASNTKYKVEEMNILNRRREILSDFGAQAYELWQKGEQFPESLAALLQELSTLDETLNAIRTEKLAGVKTEADSKENPPAAEEQQPDETADEELEAHCEETPLMAGAEQNDMPCEAHEEAQEDPTPDDDQPEA